MDMESFVLRPTTWPGLRVLSCNPLVRASDRIESVVVMAAAVAVLLGAAAAGALGTVVYGARTQMYAEQAQTRHAVVATAVADSTMTSTPQTVAATVYARWQRNGVASTAEIIWDKPVKAGDRLQIWVDDDGLQVTAPVPVSRAATDAIFLAILAWLAVVLAAGTGVDAVRAGTRRLRDAQWDREIRCLVDDDGGHTNRMP